MKRKPTNNMKTVIIGAGRSGRSYAYKLAIEEAKRQGLKIVTAGQLKQQPATVEILPLAEESRTPKQNNPFYHF